MLSSTRKIASRAAAARVGDVGQHPFDAEGVEVASAHLDDRAETAVERAAARRFDDVDLAAEQRVALEHARRAIGQLERIGRQVRDRRDRGCGADAAPSRYDSPAISATVGVMLDRAQQLAQRALALAANQEIDLARLSIGVGREARIVAAGDDPCRGTKAPHQSRDLERGGALKRHHRQPHDVGFESRRPIA